MSMVTSQTGPRTPKLTGGARAAVLLLAVGAEEAAKVLRHLSSEDLRELKKSAAGLESVSPSVIEELVEQFQTAFKSVPGLSGPPDQIDLLLQNALGEDEYRTLFADEAGPAALPGESGSSLWEEIEGISAEDVAPKLAREHPQVIAFLLSQISSATAALIVREFDTSLRNSVMQRMLSLRAPKPPVRRLFETHVRQALLAKVEDAEQSGSHAVLAEIVNRLEKAHSDDLLQVLRVNAPQEAIALKRYLFSFEDIPSLSRRARLTLFDAVPTEMVILALRGADEEIRSVVLDALSARAKRMVEAELAQEADLKTEEIDGARRQIAGDALRLAGEGRIEISEPAEEA